MARFGRAQPIPHRTRYALGSATLALTGTITAGTVKADIVAGGKTIILTVTGDNWVAAGGPFDGQRQGFINGLTSAQGEAAGWNAVVKVGMAVTDVVRTSNTVVTITLEAFASYNITATETITATVPSTSLVLGNALVAVPTFTVATGVATALFRKTFSGIGSHTGGREVMGWQ